MTPRAAITLALLVLGLVFGLPIPRASAHPLFRIHVRPSAYRVAPPRLRLPSVARQAVALIPQALALSPQASARVLAGRLSGH